MAADHARKIDPTIAARYHRLIIEASKHHNSATCTIAADLLTRIAWLRNGTTYQLRDTDGRHPRARIAGLKRAQARLEHNRKQRPGSTP